MCIVQRASPASAGASATYIIPKPSKEQLEKAFRRTQAQLHAQGFPVTLGAVDRALAQAFGVGKLDELGCIPGELQAVQVGIISSRVQDRVGVVACCGA